jgi:hypothetical protein
MHSDQLPLKVGRQFGYLHTVFTTDACDLIAVGAAFGGLFQIKQAGVPAGNLHTFVSAIGSPFGDAVPAVERSLIARELRKKTGLAP